MPAGLPSVLILGKPGGVNTVARHLVTFLCGDEGEEASPAIGTPLVKFIRIADRFSMEPATTYLDLAFKRCLARSIVEYKQTNLSVAAKVAEVFTAPPSFGSFDYIFDLTGETRADRPEIIHFQQSYNLPINLAKHAATTKHKAYVRLVFPYYIMSSSLTGGYPERFVEKAEREKKEKKGLFRSSKDKANEGLGPKPDDIRGRWWHESVRAQGAVSNLRFATLRVAEPYGEAYMEGQILARLVIAHIYKYKNEEMKFLHNPDLRLHSVHVRDVARALWKTAEWLAFTEPARALEIAGEEIPSAWSWSKGKEAEQEKAGMKLISDPMDQNIKVVVPYFNVVDQGDTTQDKLAKASGEVFGVKHGFHNAMISSLVTSFNRNDFSLLVDDINEDHMEAWQDMMAKSTPPIIDTAISPFLTEDSFRKKAINLSGSKFQNTVGWTPTVEAVNATHLRLQAESFQRVELWPKI